jgi:hypothetical protein
MPPLEPMGVHQAVCRAPLPRTPGMSDRTARAVSPSPSQQPGRVASHICGGGSQLGGWGPQLCGWGSQLGEGGSQLGGVARHVGGVAPDPRGHVRHAGAPAPDPRRGDANPWRCTRKACASASRPTAGAPLPSRHASAVTAAGGNGSGSGNGHGTGHGNGHGRGNGHGHGTGHGHGRGKPEARRLPPMPLDPGPTA